MWDFPFDIFVAVQLIEPDVFVVNAIRQVGIDGRMLSLLQKE